MQQFFTFIGPFALLDVSDLSVDPLLQLAITSYKECSLKSSPWRYRQSSYTDRIVIIVHLGFSHAKRKSSVMESRTPDGKIGSNDAI